MENNKRKWDFQSIIFVIIVLVGFIVICGSLIFFLDRCMKEKENKFEEKTYELEQDKYVYGERTDKNGNVIMYKIFIKEGNDYIKLNFYKTHTTITNTCTAENAYVKYFENGFGDIEYAEICLPKQE